MSDNKAQHYQLNIPLEIDYAQLAAQIDPSTLAMVTDKAKQKLEEVATELILKALEHKLIHEVVDGIVDNDRHRGLIADDVAERINLDSMVYDIADRMQGRYGFYESVAECLNTGDIACEVDLGDLANELDLDTLAACLDSRAIAECLERDVDALTQRVHSLEALVRSMEPKPEKEGEADAEQ